MADPSPGSGKRGAYKAAEVCEIAHIQPYVLRSWETEFPRMGVVRGGSRIYRQTDLEQVLRIKKLVFEEGLTLAGARRRIDEEGQPQPELPLEEIVTPETRERIGRVKDGLRELLGLLGGREPAADSRQSTAHRAAQGAERQAASGDGKPRTAPTAAAHKKKSGAVAHAKARPPKPRRHIGRA